MSQQDRNRYDRQDTLTQQVITECMTDLRLYGGCTVREAWHMAIRLRATVR
jgi:hypothetical protein